MEQWYRLEKIPDLTLNKYSSLEEKGVDGVLKKHVSFLRQLNRKGIISNVSFHLFYLYIGSDVAKEDMPGYRLHIFLMAQGEEKALKSVPAIIKSSSLSEFYEFKGKCINEKEDITIDTLLDSDNGDLSFNCCVALTKAEKHIVKDNETYFALQEWECNEDGRLYNMFNIMEKLGHTALYRVDLYPVDKSEVLREDLQKPMSFLRKRQEERGYGVAKDYEGKDVVKQYEEIIEQYEAEPHFIANIFSFGNIVEEAISIMDAAGSESLLKGKYEIASFRSSGGENFTCRSFIENYSNVYQSEDGRVVLAKGRLGSIICKKETAAINLNYLPTLFTLEEVAPFFRLPALYDGETIQIIKETAPEKIEKDGAIYLGKDDNGYDVYFPLKLFPKHAFIAGVPGSGKTNTMHHITSSLLEKNVPFLVLEPAKQEYRALLNDPKMQGVYLFSPNADMSFPLHINPFEMPKGIMVAEHIRRLCSVFEGAFPLEAPMPFLLDTSIEGVYRELGWIPEHVYTGDEKMENGAKRPLPTMSMLYRRLEEELKTTNYSDEVRGNLESALKVRIGSLLRREMGDVFDVPESTFAPEKWMLVPAVIELESMGTGPANFLTLMLCSLIRETLKVNPHYDKGDVRHVIFLEEAHNLIGPESEEKTGADADPKQAATAFVVKMLAEVRALKEGIIIADQLPTVMAQEVLKNTGLKIGLRITSSDDRSLLGSTMAASNRQLEEMSTFMVGRALLFYEKLMRPFSMQIHRWHDEIDDYKVWEVMTSSKPDEDLRVDLVNNSAYLYSTRKSVRIIAKKYCRKLDDMEGLIRRIKYFYNRIEIACKQYREHLNLVLDAETKKIILTDEEKIVTYDEGLVLKNCLLDGLKDFDEQLKVTLKVYEAISNMCDELERLKCGRWARYNLPENYRNEIIKLETKMANKLVEMNKSFNLLFIELSQLQDIQIKGILKKKTTYELVGSVVKYMEQIEKRNNLLTD